MLSFEPFKDFYVLIEARPSLTRKKNKRKIDILFLLLHNIIKSFNTKKYYLMRAIVNM